MKFGCESLHSRKTTHRSHNQTSKRMGNQSKDKKEIINYNTLYYVRYSIWHPRHSIDISTDLIKEVRGHSIYVTPSL